MMQSWKTTLILAVTLMSLALTSTSCNTLGALIAVAAPPQKIKPVYAPPSAGRRVLVFVDDEGMLGYEPIKRDLTEGINAKLMEYKLAGEVVSYQELLEVRAAHLDFDNTKRMGYVDVGRLCKADLVLLVMIEPSDFRLQEDHNSNIYDGILGARLRWADAHGQKDHTTLWPTDLQRGYPVPPVKCPVKAAPSNSYASELTEKLARKMATRVVNLFRAYEVPANRELEATED